MQDQVTTAVRCEVSPHERLVIRRLEARGEFGLAEALLRLRGTVAGAQYRLDRLYAIGGEGAVFDCTDLSRPDGRALVAKVPLHRYHRPARLDSDGVRRMRDAMRVEAEHLMRHGTRYMAEGVALVEFVNPLLDPARCGAFAEVEPALVMEKLPGQDLDRWLARAHRAEVPRAVLCRTLDRVAVVLTQALSELRRNGLIYADLRPGNIRLVRQPSRHIRLIDAGSLVRAGDRSGRFPHVPAYLPPFLFQRHAEGHPIHATDAVQAVMAGRTLYEVATGVVPHPGTQPDLSVLVESNVSRPVATIVAGLIAGRFARVEDALGYLVANASRRVRDGNAGTIRRVAAVAHPHPAIVRRDPPPLAWSTIAAAPPIEAPGPPRARRRDGTLRRLFGRLFRWQPAGAVVRKSSAIDRRPAR